MILIPVKALENAKQRLSPMLAASRRAELARAMIQDVFEAVAEYGRERVMVITGDKHARKLAIRHGFDVMEDKTNPGESGAVEMATRACVKREAKFTLVLPGDIPLIAAEEVKAIFGWAPKKGVVLVPSGDGRGSNAVLRRPASLMPLRFGNDSFEPHLEAAIATGNPCIVLPLPGIGLDVDTPEDLLRLIEAPGETRSQRLARSWNLGARSAAAHNA